MKGRMRTQKHQVARSRLHDPPAVPDAGRWICVVAGAIWAENGFCELRECDHWS
jgi:hypothetical protein